MSAIDSIIALRIIKLIVDPFSTWDACKTGVIDSDGKLLVTNSNTMTSEQRESWTMLQRLVWRIKLILAKIPAGKTQFASMAAAYLLVKESVEQNSEPNNLYSSLIEMNNHVTPELVEEMMANSVAAGGVDMSPQEVLNPKKKILKRFKDYAKVKQNGDC